METKKKIKVLMVDDDEITREMYVEVFRNSGFEVMEAKDGIEGLDIATKNVPDVIFTGIIMPRMDGFSMMEALKKSALTANIPVIVSSHIGREEDRMRSIALGARDFVIRGFTSPHEVVENIMAIFHTGGGYKLIFDAYSLDAQKLARDFRFDDDYQCMECSQKMVMEIKVKSAKNKVFEARFVCPECGWVAK